MTKADLSGSSSADGGQGHRKLSGVRGELFDRRGGNWCEEIDEVAIGGAEQQRAVAAARVEAAQAEEEGPWS